MESIWSPSSRLSLDLSAWTVGAVSPSIILAARASFEISSPFFEHLG